jgi:hypothetical protein
MRKVILLSLVIICAIAIIHGFFMPWAKAGTSAGKIARGATGAVTGLGKQAPGLGSFFGGVEKTANKVTSVADAAGINMAVSGYSIPKMMNTKSSQVAVALAGIFVKDAKDADKKSYAVYLMPIFALVCIALAIVGMKNLIALIVMAVISGGISLGGLFKLMTTDLNNAIVAISIENGLWQTLYAYLLICVVSVIWIALDALAARK